MISVKTKIWSLFKPDSVWPFHHAWSELHTDLKQTSYFTINKTKNRTDGHLIEISCDLHQLQSLDGSIYHEVWWLIPVCAAYFTQQCNNPSKRNPSAFRYTKEISYFLVYQKWPSSSYCSHSKLSQVLMASEW